MNKKSKPAWSKYETQKARDRRVKHTGGPGQPDAQKGRKEEEVSALGFIPRRLYIKNRPELSNFPSNILFVSTDVKNGKSISGSAVYEPGLSTFKEDKERQSMKYFNRYGSGSWVEIFYSKKKGEYKYKGDKYVKGKKVFWAVGMNWKVFFTHLTTPGLFEGEPCLFEEVKEKL